MTSRDSEGGSAGPSNERKRPGDVGRVISGEIDPERLALLLEGKLAEPARSELLAQLASSDEDLGVLVDAASIAADIEASPSSTAQRGKWPSWFDRRGWYALAAAILVAAVLPIAYVIQRRGNTDATSFVSVLIDDGRAPGVDAPFVTWAATRSAEGPVVTPRARSVRLGARSTDLELAIRNGDPRSAAIAMEMASLLDAIPAAGPVAEIYRSIAAQPADSSKATALAKQGRRAIRQLPGDSLVAAGAWLEAARLAAHQRDARFFERPETKNMVARLRSIATLHDSTRARLVSFETPPSSQVEWDGRERLSTEALLALGS